MASPSTNLLAPRMAPKKLDSGSMVFRTDMASFSLIKSADRSASLAICLTDIASRLNRAAPSAIRPENATKGDPANKSPRIEIEH